MTNISFTEERAKDLLYTSQPMGTEAYYIFVSPRDTSISSGDYSALNGKTVGVTEGSIQTGMFRRWAEMHDIRVNLVETKASGEEALRMLGGQLDAFITMDIHGNPENAVPVCKIGASDFYFAISKSRPELLGGAGRRDEPDTEREQILQPTAAHEIPQELQHRPIPHRGGKRVACPARDDPGGVSGRLYGILRQGP